MVRLLIFSIVGLFFVSCSSENAQLNNVLNRTTKHQSFSIKLLTDTILVGEAGTLIEISRGSFVDQDGTVLENVEIKLEEFYTISDFVANRLSTHTVNGEILRSSGMINIEAQSDGRVAYLKEGETIRYGFPKIQKSRVANLFSGSRSKTGAMQWEELEPVHVDTTLILNAMVEMLAYGAEKVTILLNSAIIGNDTIPINEENIDEFENVESRIYEGEYSFQPEEMAAPSFRTFNKDRFYIFESTQLGWVNCDIFLDLELFPFMISSNKKYSDISVILDDFNSVIYPDSMNMKEGIFIYYLPVDFPITISSYAKDGDTHYFNLSAVNTSKKEISVALKPMALAEIEEIVKKLR